MIQISSHAVILAPSRSIRIVKKSVLSLLVYCCCVGVEDHWTLYGGGVSSSRISFSSLISAFMFYTSFH